MAACLLLLLASPAPAQCINGVCRPPVAPHPAVVRIANALPRGITCYGSGTLVAKDDAHGTVLTCAHLFREGAGKVSVMFPNGQQFAARLLNADPTWDLAALEIDEPPANPVAIASVFPKPDETLESCGYGPDGRYVINRGRVLGYARINPAGKYETLQISGSAREGDSGGPIFNARGELVAVLWGTDGRTVDGTYCGRIHLFLAGLLPRRQPPQQLPQQPPQQQLPRTDPVEPPKDSRLPLVGDRLEDLRQRLADRDRSLGDRMERIEKGIGLIAGLKERIDKTESAVGPENLRAIVRDVAGGLATQAAPSVLEKFLPAALAALGWTGPPSIAAIIALRLLVTLMKRRAGKRKRAGAMGGLPALAPNSGRQAATGTPSSNPKLNDDYAEQLAGLYALSGRSPVADATLGREYDEALRQAETSSDAALSRWARLLRERVARRFFRIHDQSPTPAEPLENAA